MSEDFKKLGPPVRLEHAGLRVDLYLAKNYPFFSREEWQKRIANGQLLVNQRHVRPAFKVAEDDLIQMYHPTKIEPSVTGRLELLYCDSGVAVVSKPAGLPMHEGGAFRFNTFANWLKELLGEEWAAVHRLDKETSGLVMCAHSEPIRRDLAMQLCVSKVKKEYRAIVHGQPTSQHWYVDAPIGDLEESQIRIKNWVVSQGGQDALTEFSVIEQYADRALIAAFPRTGRTNQIRIHAAYSGYPLVGDKLYHPDESVFLDYWENGANERVTKATGHWRCCLHAYALSFEHPVLRQNLSVRGEPPTDFHDALHGGDRIIGQVDHVSHPAIDR